MVTKFFSKCWDYNHYINYNVFHFYMCISFYANIVREVIIPTPVYLHIKLYTGDAVQSELSFSQKFFIGLGLSVLAVAAAPFVLAATVQRQIQICSLIFTATGSAVNMISRHMKRSVPFMELERTFKLFKSKNGIVNYKDIEPMLIHLNLNLKGRDLKQAYMKATGRCEETHITYREFLKLFNVRLLRGQELKTILEEKFDDWVCSPNRRISLKDLETMLESMNVCVSREYLEKSLRSTTGFFYYYFRFDGTISRENFLKMCEL